MKLQYTFTDIHKLGNMEIKYALMERYYNQSK